MPTGTITAAKDSGKSPVICASASAVMPRSRVSTSTATAGSVRTVLEKMCPRQSSRIVAVTGISVAAGAWVRYQIEVPNGASHLLLATYGGTGDADLYVRRAAEPTTSLYDCRPFRFGNDETCFFPAPQSGTWYVYVRGFSASAGISLYPSFVDANYPYKQAATVEQLTNHRTRVTLTWQHGKRQVDIYRNGLIYNSRRNNYTFTDNFRIVGTGTMTYKICNQGTTECSNDVSVTYTSAK